MTKAELSDAVLKMVATVYKKDQADLSLETTFKDDLNSASVWMVALVSEIENELDVSLMLADASQCKTIGDLVDLVEEEMEEDD